MIKTRQIVLFDPGRDMQCVLFHFNQNSFACLQAVLWDYMDLGWKRIYCVLIIWNIQKYDLKQNHSDTLRSVLKPFAVSLSDLGSAHVPGDRIKQVPVF